MGINLETKKNALPASISQSLTVTEGAPELSLDSANQHGP